MATTATGKPTSRIGLRGTLVLLPDGRYQRRLVETSQEPAVAISESGTFRLDRRLIHFLPDSGQAYAKAYVCDPDCDELFLLDVGGVPSQDRQMQLLRR